MAEDVDIRNREEPPWGGGSVRRRRSRSLSGKLLVLTILFVMLAEVLIYVPSIANFRITWLKERIASAQIASLALKAAPDLEVSSELAKELLTNAQVIAVVLERGEARELILRSDMPPQLDERYDLRESMRLGSVLDAFETLVSPRGRVIGIVDEALFGSGERIEIVIDETLLKDAMWRFSVNVLSLSVVISVITAMLVYLALNWMMVRPVGRLTRSMLQFSERPEDPSRVISPSGRDDEIGRAEAELAAMQRQLQSMLQQKAHLAALGLAVSKINHDLRNMLAHAQLMSERLRSVKDPAVEPLVPKLVASLDRAITLCENTLAYGRAQEPPPVRRRFALAPLVEEITDLIDPGQSAAGQGGQIRFSTDIAADLQVDADRDQLFRILVNLVRNSVQAIEAMESGGGGEVRISARRDGTVVSIRVSDTGPGLSEKARAHLFEAFSATGKRGGAGLGLAIAAELVRAHGGDIRLVEQDRGAAFDVEIPDRVEQLDVGRLRTGT